MTHQCPVDHWLWTANGLHGIASMLGVLDSASIPPSEDAIRKLKEHLTVIQQLVEKHEKK